MERFASISARHAELIPVKGEGGLTLNLYSLYGSPPSDRPVILFGHACGFAAGSYLPLLSRLSEFADVFAFDARGHGGSDAPPADLSVYGPDTHALDLVRIGRAVAAHTDARSIFYVGHSLGAAAMLRLGGLHAGLFATLPWQGLVLFEPPIFPSAERPEYAECVHKDRQLVQRTAARRARWPSREMFVDILGGRGPFRAVAREALVAHADAALRPVPAGDHYELCCPPAVEARTYSAFADDSTFRALAAFPRAVPLHLIGGDATNKDTRSWVTLMAPGIAAALALDLAGRPVRRFTGLAGCGHLLPLEDAKMTCDLIRDSLSSR